MEKEELKRRLVKLKKVLAEKKRKLQKCERLSKARHHVQQKIREQSYLMENEHMLSDGCSGHIHTKVTFEKCCNDEACLSSTPDQRKKLLDCEHRPVSATSNCDLPSTKETVTHSSSSVTNYCFSNVSQRSAILKNPDENSQQLELAVDKKDNGSASPDCLNSTYIIKSSGNWVNSQPVVTDVLHTTAHSQDLCTGGFLLNQKVCRTNKNHQTFRANLKSLPISKERCVATKSDSSCEYHIKCQRNCDGTKESVDLQHCPIHVSDRCLLGSLGNDETSSDTKTSFPTGLFPNTEISNDTKLPSPASECQTGINKIEQEPVNERYENKKAVDPPVKKSILDKEPEPSEDIQDVAFSVYHNNQTGQEYNDSEHSTLDIEDKVLLTVEEDKENINQIRHLESLSSGDNKQHSISANKQNKTVKSKRRYSGADLLDFSFCDWEGDMYSQVKSRKNRRERHLSVQCEKVVLSQAEMVPFVLSQSDRSAEDKKAKSGNKTRKCSLSKTDHRHKMAIGHSNGHHLKSDTCLINAAFVKMLSEIQPQISDFVLPENDFGKLLSTKVNNYKPVASETIQSAPSTQENVEELHFSNFDHDCGYPYDVIHQYVMDEDSKDPRVDSAQNSLKMIGYEMDMNGGSSSLSQDSSILSSDTTKELFFYHSSIKMNHSEPILSLWCEVNERLTPHEVIASCTPFRVMIWVRRGTGWSLKNVWTLEELEAECILSCHISACHRWIFIWTTVQCSTRLTAASTESNKLLKLLWTTNLLFTPSQKHFSFKLSIAELIVGSVTPNDHTHLMKVLLNECNGTLVVDEDVKSVELDVAEEQLMSVIPIEGLPESLLGISYSVFYIWNHVSGRLVQRVTIGHKLASCPLVYHHQGILLMAVIMKSDMMGYLLAVNPTTGRTSILCTLETKSKDTNMILASLQNNGKLLCGLGEDSSLWLWCAHSGKLVSYSCKRLPVVSIRLCQERLLIVIQNTIHVYYLKY